MEKDSKINSYEEARKQRVLDNKKRFEVIQMEHQ